LLGLGSWCRGKSAEAIAELQRLGVENPNLRGLAHERVLPITKPGTISKAIDAFKKATQEDPGDKEAVQLLGLSNYLAGRPADAIPLLERVQGWYPRANVDASYILGVCYIQTKDYPKSRVAFARMFDVAPDSAAAYLFTARMLLRQEFDPIAEEYARKAIELDPKLPLAHFFLGELHLYKSRIPEAIADFQAELGLNRDTRIPITNWRTLTRECEVRRSGALLQRSIWLDSTSTGAYILLGKCARGRRARRSWQHALCSMR
jgi:tetratricopeptide (TPR) repeat protein